jgi:hypothetical protein
MRHLFFHNEKLCCDAPPHHSTWWKAEFAREIGLGRRLASRFAKPGRAGPEWAVAYDSRIQPASGRPRR